MSIHGHLSTVVQQLLDHTEQLLESTITILRREDVCGEGFVIDTFSHRSDSHYIVIPSTRIGLLKDLAIALQCVQLLMRGAAYKAGELKVLSFNEHTAAKGVQQIYFDTLKDERTRKLDVKKKKRITFYLYVLFFETLNELPWQLLAHLIIARSYDVLRTVQVYDMMKGSIQDMHELVAIKGYLPARYFILHNGMYYARDHLFADVTASYELHPVINIPELRRFKRLEVKEMLSRRWGASSWYHTTIIGETLYTSLKSSLLHQNPPHDLSGYLSFYRSGVEITDRWMEMMHIQEWYHWDTPDRQYEAIAHQDAIALAVERMLFGE